MHGPNPSEIVARYKLRAGGGGSVKLLERSDGEMVFFTAYAALQRDLAAANARIAAQQARIEWLSQHVFDRKWDGTIGRAPYWQMAGPYRHTLVKMRGNTLEEAIDSVRLTPPAGSKDQP